MRNLKNSIWRANQMSQNGFDPGNFGEGDYFTMILLIVIVIATAVSS